MAKVLITGCSRGIGYQLAKQFAEAGHLVLALSRNAAPISELGMDNIQAFPFDICREEDHAKLKHFIENEWGELDILINNAGSLLNRPFLETTLEEFKQVYEVNVFGITALMQLVIPFMGKDGHVVNISSMGGVQGSTKFPGLAAYSSSKGALITLTELLAEEFKSTGPAFNVLALGAVQTEMLAEAFPGFQANVSPADMATYIMNFALSGHRFYNGKLLPVSNSTP